VNIESMILIKCVLNFSPIRFERSFPVIYYKSNQKLNNTQ